MAPPMTAVPRHILLLVVVAALVDVSCTARASKSGGKTGAPETFFAVTGGRTRIVEVHSDTGKVRRIVVDVRRGDGDFVEIGALDLAPERRALYYSVSSELPHGSIYRVVLPAGEPERIADGVGPSVSRDGTRLAYVTGTVLHHRLRPHRNRSPLHHLP